MSNIEMIGFGKKEKKIKEGIKLIFNSWDDLVITTSRGSCCEDTQGRPQPFFRVSGEAKEAEKIKQLVGSLQKLGDVEVLTIDTFFPFRR